MKRGDRFARFRQAAQENNKMQSIPQQQPQQQGILFHAIGGFSFSLPAVLAMDTSQYEAGAPDRKCKVVLVGPYVHEFTEKAADEFYMWVLALSQGARIATPEMIQAPPAR